MECVITANGINQFVLLPDTVFNDNLLSIENRFESIFNKLCDKQKMMPPIIIPRFDIIKAQQQLFTNNIIKDQLPSSIPPLLSQNRSRSMSSDSIPPPQQQQLQQPPQPQQQSQSNNVTNHKLNIIKNNNNITLNSNINHNSGYHHNHNNNNNMNLNNNNNNNIAFNFTNNIRINHTINKNISSSMNDRKRTFQSVNPLNHYKTSMKLSAFKDNKHKRRLYVQSNINSIRNNNCRNINNLNNKSFQIPKFPQYPIVTPIPSQMNINTTTITPNYHHVNRRQPIYHHNLSGYNNYNIRSNSSGYPQTVTITARNNNMIDSEKCDDYQIVLKDYIQDNKLKHIEKRLKYGEAELSEIVPSTQNNYGNNNDNNISEYKLVIGRFLKFTNLSGLNNLEIVKVWKIYNKKLMDDYKWRKQSILRGLDNDLNKLNEKCLYHGTSIGVIPKIITQGFLRQFTTRHAFGQGCYFAVNPSYSAHPRYSRPNSKGIQFIFVCSVICGEFCKGNAKMKVPDIKPNTNNILYETTVNDINKPTVFVTFNDNQAIARYLIAFKNNNNNNNNN